MRLTKSMEAIEVLPAANLIKFFGELEMEKLIKPDGIINGFAETPVTFTTLGSDLKFKVKIIKGCFSVKIRHETEYFNRF